MSKRSPRLNAAPSQPELIRSRWLTEQNVLIWMLICLSMTSLLVALAIKLLTWTEAVIVLEICWLVWCTVLSGIFYYGVRDDDRLGQPTNWFPGWLSAAQSQNEPKHSWNLGSGSHFSKMDGRVCVLLVGVLFALAFENVPPGAWLHYYGATDHLHHARDHGQRSPSLPREHGVFRLMGCDLGNDFRRYPGRRG